ncbi:hypothetical protein P8610_15570 [Fictibacillus sp. UD]
MIGVQGARLSARTSGQVRPFKAQSGKGLTARPAESEATWNGNQLLTRATKFARTAIH